MIIQQIYTPLKPPLSLSEPIKGNAPRDRAATYHPNKYFYTIFSMDKSLYILSIQEKKNQFLAKIKRIN